MGAVGEPKGEEYTTVFERPFRISIGRLDSFFGAEVVRYVRRYAYPLLRPERAPMP